MIEVVSEISKVLYTRLISLHIADPIEEPDFTIFKNNKELSEQSRLMNLSETRENKWSRRAKQIIENLNEQKIKSEIKCLTGPII